MYMRPTGNVTPRGATWWKSCSTVVFVDGTMVDLSYPLQSNASVRIVTDRRPGTLGQQPTIHGSTLTCGPSEESLRRAARRWIRSQVDGYPGTCACGDVDCDGVRPTVSA
jgi:hypothetical protein